MPKTIAQLKDFYTSICNGALPESELDLLTGIISLLEKETGQDFRDTEDFRSKMDRYFSRKERPGELLLRARKKKNWTQEIMGAYLGVSRQFVKEMEKGRKPLIDKALSFINQLSM